MCIHPLLIVLGIVVVAGLCVISFSIGYSSGEGNAHKEILARQQQTEAAKHWREVLEKLNERGAV